MKRLLYFITILIVGISLVGCRKKEIVQQVIEADYPEILTDITEKVEKYDYIFVGHIVQELETLQFEGKGSSLPKTRYSVNVLKVLKGELEENIVIQKIGGINEDGLLMEYSQNKLPEVGSVMIIFSGKFEEDNNPDHDPRNEVGIYSPGPSEEAMDLLENYDISKSINEQSDIIKDKINDVVSAIDYIDNNETLKTEKIIVIRKYNDEIVFRLKGYKDSGGFHSNVLKVPKSLLNGIEEYDLIEISYIPTNNLDNTIDNLIDSKIINIETIMSNKYNTVTGTVIYKDEITNEMFIHIPDKANIVNSRYDKFIPVEYYIENDDILVGDLVEIITYGDYLIELQPMNRSAWESNVVKSTGGENIFTITQANNNYHIINPFIKFQRDSYNNGHLTYYIALDDTKEEPELNANIDEFIFYSKEQESTDTINEENIEIRINKFINYYIVDIAFPIDENINGEYLVTEIFNITINGVDYRIDFGNSDIIIK